MLKQKKMQVSKFFLCLVLITLAVAFPVHTTQAEKKKADDEKQEEAKGWIAVGGSYLRGLAVKSDGSVWQTWARSRDAMHA